MILRCAVSTKSTETRNNCYGLLLSSWCSGYGHLLRAIFFAFLCFHHAFATTFLSFLVVVAGSFSAIINLYFGKFGRQVFFQPSLAFLVIWIVLAVLQINVGNLKMLTFAKHTKVSQFTSIGMVQLPQYCTVIGYVNPFLGPLIRCSGRTEKKLGYGIQQILWFVWLSGTKC